MKKMTMKLRSPYKRDRNKSYPIVFSGHYRNVIQPLPSGTPQVVGNELRSSLAVQQVTMSDIVTPGFEYKKAVGGIVNSPMKQAWTTNASVGSGFEVEIRDTARVQTWTESKAQPFYFGWASHLLHGINVQNLKNYASTKCLAGMKPSSFMGFVSLAEGPKTLNMILHPLQNFSKLLQYVTRQRQAGRNLVIHAKGNTLVVNGRSFVRGSPGRGYKGPGKVVTRSNSSIVIPAGSAISGGVLAVNLGLGPLLQDIESILKEIPTLHQEPRLTSRSTISDESTRTAVTTVVQGNVTARRTVTTTTKITVRASVLYEDKFDVLADFGMSLGDIPSAAYELIPYSFLLDYLINLGDLLSASQMLQTRKILSANLVTTIDTVTTATYDSLKVSGWVVKKDLSETDTITSKTKEREVTLENPMIAYKPISKILRPSVIQNTLSLIVQQLTHLGKAKRTFY